MRPTKTWFCRAPFAEGRKNYTKIGAVAVRGVRTAHRVVGWCWRAGRVENDHAWKVSSELIATDGYNLDLRNPHRPDDPEHRSPKDLVAEMIETETEILRLLQEIEIELAEDAK